MISINETKKDSLEVLTGSLPASLDPIDYDYFKNHPFQSITHVRLISSYQGMGGVLPQLARSWKSERSDTEWTFSIREDLHFSDGSKVNSSIVIFSLKRIILLLRRAGTKNEFINNLLGIDDFRKLSDPLLGLSEEGGGVVRVRVKKSIPNLAEILSFGIFSIVSPKNFDENGTWVPKTFSDVIGAGPYVFENSLDTEINLILRQDYPKDLVHSRPFKKIKFFTDNGGKRTGDLYFGTSDSERFHGADFNFFGRGARNIMYLHLLPWSDPRHPFSRREVRCLLRKTFQAELIASESKTTNSFFPLVMPGISEPANVQKCSDIDLASIKGFEIKFNDSRPSGSKRVRSAIEAFERAVKKLGLIPIGLKGVPLEKIQENKNPNKKSHDIDVAIMGTGVSLEDPMSDIRLMFSPEGVFLPDLDGMIEAELKKPTPNPQVINELLYEQGIILPITRYDLGIWASRDLDLTNYNTLLPIGELQWIGFK